MQSIEVPPDATPFRSDGTLVFLYLGAAEAIALQAEWGLRKEPDDTVASYTTKRERLEARLKGDDFADRVTVMRVCLGQWAEQSGVDVSTDKLALKILERAMIPGTFYGPGKKFGPLYRLNTLWQRMCDDMLGLNEPEEEAEGEQTAPKGSSVASTQSETSSPQPSAGDSPAAKPTGSRRGRSASSSGRATRPVATS